MKQVQAYIKQHRLDEVVHSLRKIEGLTGMSVLTVQGYGLGIHSSGPDQEIFSKPGVKLEVFCRNEVAPEVVAVIEKSAHTGLKGDGKIYVTNVEQAVRISTGKRGEDAV